MVSSHIGSLLKHVTHQLFPFHKLNLQKMTKITQFDGHKIYFCNNKVISKELLCHNLGYLFMVCSVSLKI